MLRDMLRQDLKRFLGLGALFLTGALLEPYGTERPYAHEKGDAVERDHLTLRDRLGYAILLRAGYAEVQLIGSAPSDSTEESINASQPELLLTSRPHVDLGCLLELPPAVSPNGVEVDLPALATAVAAAERYNRGAFQRRSELSVAELGLRARGRLPELSLGVAQIRPVIARRLLSSQLPGATLQEEDVLAMLGDSCQNVRLAALHLGELVARDSAGSSVNAVVESAATAYNGGGSASVQGLRYADAVAGAYALLTGRVPGLRGDPPLVSDAEPGSSSDSAGARLSTVVTCVEFPAFGVAGDTASLTGWRSPVASDSATAADSTRVGALNFGQADVVASVLQVEPGPASYRSTLLELRRRWLGDWLAAQGVSPNRVTVREVSAMQGCDESPFDRTKVQVKATFAGVAR